MVGFYPRLKNFQQARFNLRPQLQEVESQEKVTSFGDSLFCRTLFVKGRQSILSHQNILHTDLDPPGDKEKSLKQFSEQISNHNLNLTQMGDVVPLQVLRLNPFLKEGKYQCTEKDGSIELFPRIVLEYSVDFFEIGIDLGSFLFLLDEMGNFGEQVMEEAVLCHQLDETICSS